MLGKKANGIEYRIPRSATRSRVKCYLISTTEHAHSYKKRLSCRHVSTAKHNNKAKKTAEKGREYLLSKGLNRCLKINA